MIKTHPREVHAETQKKKKKKYFVIFPHPDQTMSHFFSFYLFLYIRLRSQIPNVLSFSVRVFFFLSDFFLPCNAVLPSPVVAPNNTSAAFFPLPLFTSLRTTVKVAAAAASHASLAKRESGGGGGGAAWRGGREDDRRR